MAFDKNRSKLAIVLPSFQLLKSSDFRRNGYNEPYIVSMAIDANGPSESKIGFNVMPFPKVRPGQMTCSH